MQYWKIVVISRIYTSVWYDVILLSTKSWKTMFRGSLKVNPIFFLLLYSFILNIREYASLRNIIIYDYSRTKWIELFDVDIQEILTSVCSKQHTNIYIRGKGREQTVKATRWCRKWNTTSTMYYILYTIYFIVYSIQVVKHYLSWAVLAWSLTCYRFHCRLKVVKGC